MKGYILTDGDIKILVGAAGNARHRRIRRGSRRTDRIIAASWTGLGFVLGFLAAGALYLAVAMM